MRKIVDDIDDEDDDMDTKDEEGIVKDDPQFTLAITRGEPVRNIVARTSIFLSNLFHNPFPQTFVIVTR